MTTLEEFKFKKPAKKPIVKPFFDLDAALNRHIEARLPFISSAKMKIHRVFMSEDKTSHRYRVNWVNQDTGYIQRSSYVVIQTDTSGVIISFTESC